jgi:hypothetical protein
MLLLGQEGSGDNAAQEQARLQKQKKMEWKR